MTEGDVHPTADLLTPSSTHEPQRPFIETERGASFLGGVVIRGETPRGVDACKSPRTRVKAVPPCSSPRSRIFEWMPVREPSNHQIDVLSDYSDVTVKDPLGKRCQVHRALGSQKHVKQFQTSECRMCSATMQTQACAFTLCADCSHREDRCIVCCAPTEVKASLPGLFRSCDDPDFEETRCSLSDISMIVIGKGEEAKNILKRRRLEGGRALLLWTDQQPAVDRSCLAANNTAIEFDMLTFLWNPPLQSKLTRNSEVKNLRSEFGSFTRGLCRIGPDIVDLAENERYDIIENSLGYPVGVRVWEIGSGVVWEMSGQVCFAGKHFLGRVGAFDTMQKVEAECFALLCQEAKPLSTVTYRQVGVSGAWYFVQLLAFFVGMNVSEVDNEAGNITWWRLPFGLGTFWFGFGIIPCILGHSLTGLWPTTSLHLVGGCVAVVTFTTFCVCPIGYIGSPWYTFPVFDVCVLGTACYLLICMPIQAMYFRISRPTCICPDAEKKQEKFAWKCHLAWTMWLILGSFGSWIIMYLIALSYVQLSRKSAFGAALALPFMTSGCELVVATLNKAVYEKFVYRPRARSGSKAEVRGDQKSHMISVMMFTHSYAESTRLISFLADVALNPSYTWIAAYTLCFVLNIFQRTGYIVAMAMHVAPGTKKVVKLGASKVLHMEAKFSCGYPRFVAPIALIVSRLLVWGTSAPPLFNGQALGVVIFASVLEVVEDVIVQKELVLGMHPWKPKVKHLFDQMAALSPGQLCAVDSQGVHIERTSLAFHGMGFLKTADVAGTMAPATYFSYTLLTLLLGAGFVHRVCPDPISSDLAVIDGLCWQSPLRCS